jgi:PAS domain S-box-containing protein
MTNSTPESSDVSEPDKNSNNLDRQPQSIARETYCHTITNCGNVACPAYTRTDTPCWRIADTHCQTHQREPEDHKFKRCLICPVFQTHAQCDSRSWGHFVVDELTRLIDSRPAEFTVKQLEENLRLSEGNYRRLFEGSADMIFYSDRNGAFTDVNPACVNLLGYASKSELFARASVEQIYAKTIHWTVFKQQIDRHGFVKDFEAHFRRTDGSTLHCLLSGQAVRDAGGQIIGYQGIAKDITARMDAIRNFRQRHRELWVLNSVAFAMNRHQDLDFVLTTALKKVLEVLDLSAGFICLIDHGRSEFILRARHGFQALPDDIAISVNLTDRVLMQALLSKDLTLTPEPIFPPFQAVFQDDRGTFEAHLTCFLITAKNKASGFIALDVPPERNISMGHDYHLLGSMGNFLGGAIENKQLLQTIHQHREELKGLTAKLFHSQEIERQRIARELHDEAGQALTGISFALESLENLLADKDGTMHELVVDVKKQINSTFRDMRRLSHQLHPALLTDLGLEPALDAYLRSISRRTPIAIDFEIVGFEERLTPEIEGVLYRLAQEAVTNTLKHSGATRFRLSMIRGYPAIIFIAEDNGCGFDPDHFDASRPALGLLSMRERVSMLGGRFSLRSTIGKGTRVRIEIPIPDKEEDNQCQTGR